MYEFFLKAVELVHTFGYFGVFFMTFIESTFIPIPSEVTLIPAGYLVQSEQMNFIYVLLVSTLGTVAGSLVNYYIAFYYGRSLLIKYGNYFFINEKKLQAIEFFFQRHGAISTFSGRLLPGLKHFISFPAGLGKMNLPQFCLYTAAGGAIWSALLIGLGYYIGQNEQLINKHLATINIILVISIICLAAFYYWRLRQQRRADGDNSN